MSLRIKIVQKLIEINELIIFYPKLKKFYKRELNNDAPIIIDIGSNKGQFIDFIIKIRPNAKVFGFEPNPTLYKQLLLKYANNNSIIIENIGISDINGFLKFNENIMDETSSFEKLNYESDYLSTKARVLGVNKEAIIKKSYDVLVKTLSEWLKNKELKFIDLIKIDTEGHEYHCLKGLFDGALQTKIKFIQIESHADDMYKDVQKNEDIPILLENNSFKEVAKVKHGFGNFYEIIYRNNFYEA